MNKRRLLLRIIVSPLILGLLIITYIHHCLRHFVVYIRYGGEWITYLKNDPKTVQDIYKLLKEQNKENEIIQEETK